MKFKFPSLVAFAAVAAFSCGAADMSEIRLSEGGTLTGNIIHEHPEAVYIDLGFTLMNVPRKAIAQIIPLQEIGESREDYDIHLFSQLDRRQLLPVKEWAQRRGEAVVVVRTPIGLGSGFVIHNSGYVITNNHVISGEREVTITVFKQDENDLRKEIHENVRIVATNPLLDLALLKIEGIEEPDFATAPLADSSECHQGQTVFAVGSPLGLERTVSQGIISNRNRPFDGLFYIQSTAEISPGNSGGPLFNLHGEVVGVNNMKVVGMGAEGLGFAIPSNMLKLFLKNRDAFAFDSRNPNAGFRYNDPPSSGDDDESAENAEEDAPKSNVTSM